MNRRFLFITFLILSLLPVSINALSQDNVTKNANLTPLVLQLKWTHQFQFAGYYIALEDGLYRKAGLEVKINEGGPSVDVIESVVSGRADIGIGNSSLLLEFANGKPVVVLGVIFQHSPLVLLSRLERYTQTMEAFKGKTLMIEPHSAEIFLMFKKAGLSTKDIVVVPHSGNVGSFVSNEVYAMSAYTTTETVILDQKGIKYLIYSPRSYGIDFYGDNFFTSIQILEQKKSEILKFKSASIEGWRRAINDPERAIRLILEKYGSELSYQQLKREADMTIDLMTRLVTPGHMIREKWEQIAATYVETGIIAESPDLETFIYTEEVPEISPWILRGFAFGLFILIVLFYFVFKFRLMNLKLESEIRQRVLAQETLRVKNTALEKALEDIETLEGIIPICSTCKKIRNDSGGWDRLEAYFEKKSDATFSHGICPDCATAFMDS